MADNKPTRKEEMQGDQAKKCTLFVGNLPKDASNAELEKTFSEIGPVKRCFIVKDKGVGYVTYALRDDAESAVENVKTFGKNKLRLSFAREKINARKKKDDKKDSSNPPSKAGNDQIQHKPANDQIQHKSASNATKIKAASNAAKIKTPSNATKIKPNTPSSTYKDKMIVRNLSYKATEEDVKKVFEKFGHVTDVYFPKRPNGTFIGYGFVRMQTEQESSNAIAGVNSKEILGRPVAVDWAYSQEDYKKIKLQENAPKGKPEKKVEMEKDDSDSDSCISDEENDTITSDVEKNVSLNDMEADSDSEVDFHKDENSEEDMNTDDDDDEEDDEEDDDDDDDDDDEKQKGKKQKKFEQPSDTSEGRTIFIRNISFNTTLEELKQTFSKFGKLEYATLCVDPVTDHPKGSGFVKFVSKTSADECISKAGKQSEDGGINLDGQLLQICIALSKEATKKKFEEDKPQKNKDNRNLYLSREGLIRPGTQAAEGVSKEDMAKRMQLEDWKRRMLQNLHMFISTTRLSVRNIPPTMTEKTLRRIFANVGGPGATLTEVKIMRSKRKFDASGIGISQGFGFVRFEEHEHALRALRATNNNPDIFTPSSRPIVEFTLENQAVLNVKARRLENSRRKNKQLQEKDIQPKKSIGKKTPEKVKLNSDVGQITGTFVGTKSDSLDSAKLKTMPSHFGPKIRHKKRPAATSAKAAKIANKIKYRRKEERLAAQAKQKKRKEMAPPKKIQKVNTNEDNLDRLVNNYQKKLKPKEKQEQEKRKWFKH